MTLPGDVAVVIRGGVGRDPQTIYDGLMELIAAGLPARISVFAVPYDETQSFDSAVLDVCRAATAPWGQVQVTTVQGLRAKGFELLDEREQYERDCHFNLGFDQSVTLADVEDLLSCFSEPQPNPLPRAERSRR